MRGETRGLVRRRLRWLGPSGAIAVAVVCLLVGPEAVWSVQQQVPEEAEEWLEPAAVPGQVGQPPTQERKKRRRNPEDDNEPSQIIIEKSFGMEEVERSLGEDRSMPTRSRSAPGRSEPIAEDVVVSPGQDWPEWRGLGRRGVWDEGGILERFPKAGLDVKWATPIGSGFAGPAVAGGRVYVLDFISEPGGLATLGRERLHCLDAKTGSVLWTHEWEVDYAELAPAYTTGPRATPTVDVGRVYVVGATGVLRCIATLTGGLIWKKDFARDFGTRIPRWGVASAPILDGERLIAIVGGEPDARVVAFDKRTGRELWRRLPTESGLGYGQPVTVHSGGVRQLIVWDPTALSSLDPATGTVYWQERWPVAMAGTLATPVRSGPYLFVSQLFGGSLTMQLAADRAHAARLWLSEGGDESPDPAEGLHALTATPVVDGESIYDVGSNGVLRGWDARSGRRLWEAPDLTRTGQWATAFLVRRGDRYFVNNDQGELIITRLTPRGYEELDRTNLIEPTTSTAWGRPDRQLPSDRIVNWSHPAYAYRHIFARNDNRILCASLERK